MIAWTVAGFVVLSLAGLLLCPVTFDLDFEEEFAVRVRYLLIRVPLYPRPEKKKRRKEPEREEKEKREAAKESKLREMLRQRGLKGFLDLLREAARIFSGWGKRLLPHLKIGSFSLSVSVAGEDAGQTALEFAGVCGAVYPAVAVLLGSVKCRKYQVGVVPDFQGKESRVEFHCKVHIRLLFAISTSLYAAIRIMKTVIRRKKESIRQEKAVLTHGGSSNRRHDGYDA